MELADNLEAPWMVLRGMPFLNLVLFSFYLTRLSVSRTNSSLFLCH